MTTQELGNKWYDLFSRYAEDLYPERYTPATCYELAEKALEIERLTHEKKSLIVAHNYVLPEFHEIAAKVGDSLGLSFFVRDARALRVDFQSVAFMGQTAKMITGDATRVFISDYPDVLGCSLVFGTDYDWIENWQKQTNGILVTYINSDPYMKSISDYIGTSGNMANIIASANREYPEKKILVLPDRFLGYVMKVRALESGVPSEMVEVYEYFKGEYRASCYVHENIPGDAIDIAIAEHPEADILIHPECGCASTCMMRAAKDPGEHMRFFFLSTEGMVQHAKRSSNNLFIVATEKGMLYRLRKELPEKKFIPVSYHAECRYMKKNTLEKLLDSLKRDRVEIVLCDDCCDQKFPYQDEQTVHIQKSTAHRAHRAIQRMLAITS